MTLTCLIPAYNEAARIAAVLDAVLGSSLARVWSPLILWFGWNDDMVRR